MLKHKLEIFPACLFLFLFLTVSMAFADRIVMNNGDQLTGTVVKIEEGIVIIKTGYNEALELDRKQVNKIETDQPVTVRLNNGEVLTGVLQLQDETLQVDSSNMQGVTTIGWDRVATVNVPPPPVWVWSGNIFLGGNQQSGNTDRSSFNFGVEGLAKSSKNRYDLSFLYNYAEEDGALTSRDYFGSIKYDHFFTKKVYGYLVIEMMRDEFKDLNLRTIVGPGAGYQVWDTDNSYLAFDAGVSYFSEDRINAPNDHWYTGRIGVKFKQRLFEKVKFTENLMFFPGLESDSEYTLRNEATLVTTIADRWSLRLSNIWDYASDPGAGIKKSDLKTGVNLQYSF